ncbi:MAG: aconitate hydratase AcnA [Chlorobi bacterium]|nr:aconitate hydratase AcnA [Chlorobiota bacterium]
MTNSFNSKSTFNVLGKDYIFYNLNTLSKNGINLSRLPYSLKVLLENLLRCEDNLNVTEKDIMALGNWDSNAIPVKEIAFMPARVLLQDFTGVPCVVDLAAMRDAMKKFGGDASKINPLVAVDLVIDHSVQVDHYASDTAFDLNKILEYSRNRERYAFLRWGQTAFTNFRAVPPDTGIVHQVNLEYLAPVSFINKNTNTVYPDTVVGTDSHTTMINGIGVLGWGVGGIEAEAVMLGQPVSMLIPRVVGFKLTGKLSEGSTSTDLVLTVTEILRKHGVVGKFVEFYGKGLKNLSLADRATIANMAPEYGATCGIFPIDSESIRYMKFTGRTEEQVLVTEAYYKAQGMFHDDNTPEADYSEFIELDLSTVVASIAGPKRPQDRLLLSETKENFYKLINSLDKLSSSDAANIIKESSTQIVNGSTFNIQHGSVVIAAITSCTNTSNPSVLVAAGLVAKKAYEKGLNRKPWVKTSLAPGSQVVTKYLSDSGLDKYLNAIGFNNVGYGCTTCIGNSGPLPIEISKSVNENSLVVASVLSGNRNFEGRVNQDVKANYLMSPPLVVVYAIAGRIDIDLHNDPIGLDENGVNVYLKDIWPTLREVQEVMDKSVRSEMFLETYKDVFKGDELWNSLEIPEGDLYNWNEDSTYVKHPPYFEGMNIESENEIKEISNAYCLAFLGDSVTTDHISPAGAIKPSSPAGVYLTGKGIDIPDFNSYGSRRGNHEVMVRGTFANIRIRNKMLQDVEGGFTNFIPTSEQLPIYDASIKYQENGNSLVVIAGKEYGSGSSRDWAAKGTMLLGVKMVITESYERIHRSNLVGMGILPLQFINGESAESLGLTGYERYSTKGFSTLFIAEFPSNRVIDVIATKSDGSEVFFKATVRIDTPQEVLYFKNGGILPYVLRKLLSN